MEKEFVTWEDVNNYTDAVARELKDSNVTGVYGIPRGGLIFAVMLSHKMNIPLLLAPCKDCIVVDDISDTGNTLVHYKHSRYYITTMFYHRQSKVVPNLWYKEKKNSWIVYPWEV